MYHLRCMLNTCLLLFMTEVEALFSLSKSTHATYLTVTSLAEKDPVNTPQCTVLSVSYCGSTVVGLLHWMMKREPMHEQRHDSHENRAPSLAANLLLEACTPSYLKWS